MNKLRIEDEEYRLADIGVPAAIIKAVDYMARYHFEPERPDLVPGDENELMYAGHPHIGFKRAEMRSACDARVALAFRLLQRVREVEIEPGEPLYLWQPQIHISWSTSGYTPEEAIKAGEIHTAAGLAGLGLVGHLAGTWVSGPWAFPSFTLTDDQRALVYDALVEVDR